MTTAAWDSRSACKRKSPLLAAFTAAVTAPMRAAPSQKYTHSGQVRGEQRDGFAPVDSKLRKYVGCRARPVSHLRERDRSSCDRHHHAVAELLGAPVEHCRHGEAFDTERGGSDRPVPASGHHTPAAAGSGSPSAVYPKSIGDGSVPG